MRKIQAVKHKHILPIIEVFVTSDCEMHELVLAEKLAEKNLKYLITNANADAQYIISAMVQIAEGVQ